MGIPTTHLYPMLINPFKGFACILLSMKLLPACLGHFLPCAWGSIISLASEKNKVRFSSPSFLYKLFMYVVMYVYAMSAGWQQVWFPGSVHTPLIKLILLKVPAAVYSSFLLFLLYSATINGRSPSPKASGAIWKGPCFNVFIVQWSNHCTKSCTNYQSIKIPNSF